MCSKTVETSFLKSMALGLVTIILVSSVKKISLDLIFIFGKSCSIFSPHKRQYGYDLYYILSVFDTYS